MGEFALGPKGQMGPVGLRGLLGRMGFEGKVATATTPKTLREHYSA